MIELTGTLIGFLGLLQVLNLWILSDVRDRVKRLEDRAMTGGEAHAMA